MFSAQVSQTVYLADLTILRIITTVLPKTTKISYLREINPQVSQIVFLAGLTVYSLLQLYELKLQKSHISACSVHVYQKS